MNELLILGELHKFLNWLGPMECDCIEKCSLRFMEIRNINV